MATWTSANGSAFDANSRLEILVGFEEHEGRKTPAGKQVYDISPMQSFARMALSMRLGRANRRGRNAASSINGHTSYPRGSINGKPPERLCFRPTRLITGCFQFIRCFEYLGFRFLRFCKSFGLELSSPCLVSLAYPPELHCFLACLQDSIPTLLAQSRKHVCFRIPLGRERREPFWERGTFPGSRRTRKSRRSEESEESEASR